MVKKAQSLLPHMILCEGLDAKLFLIEYIQYLLNTYGDESVYNSFLVDDFGGNEQLPMHLKLLPNRPGFNDNTNVVKSIIVIRDSERDAEAAEQSIHSILSNAGFSVPDNPCEIANPKDGTHNVYVAYVLFPDINSKKSNGTLEDLCLNILSKNDKLDLALKTTTSTISAMETQGCCFARKHKNKLHTYLSLTDEYVGLKIGESAKAKAFDFSESRMEPLRILMETITERIVN